MPTYFAQILIWSVFCGLILLDEVQYYSTAKLIVIIISSLVAFIGIQILAKKSSQLVASSDNEISPESTIKVINMGMFNTDGLPEDAIELLK